MKLENSDAIMFFVDTASPVEAQYFDNVSFYRHFIVLQMQIRKIIHSVFNLLCFKTYRDRVTLPSLGNSTQVYLLFYRQ